MTRPAFLMCPPAHFNVDYEINPWMRGNLNAVSTDAAVRQWEALHDIVAEHADVQLVVPRKGLPDMVFTANAGLLLGRTFVPSNFAHRERQGERAHFARWFHDGGYRVLDMPYQGAHALAFEGAGDALFASDEPVLWLGHGFRTDPLAAPWLAAHLPVDVQALHLIDPRYYHLDTCFCPLDGGALLWNPAAFDVESRARVERRVPASHRIAVAADDAAAFACNAVSIGDIVIVNRASDALTRALRAIGKRTIETPLSEFMKSGGAAKCLTLRLDTAALPWLDKRDCDAMRAGSTIAA